MSSFYSYPQSPCHLSFLGLVPEKIVGTGPRRCIAERERLIFEKGDLNLLPLPFTLILFNVSTPLFRQIISLKLFGKTGMILSTYPPFFLHTHESLTDPFSEETEIL